MLLSFPADLWTDEHIRGAVKDFGPLITWDKKLSSYAALIVKVRVVDLQHIPHSCVVSNGTEMYAESWSVPIFILSQRLLGAAPADEDVPPADGSTPHPLPAAAPQHQQAPAQENHGWAQWQQHVPPPQHLGVQQNGPLAGPQNHIGQHLNFIFGHAANAFNLNELPTLGMPDLNALPHQLNADDFLELNDLLNPVQQDAVNLQDVEMQDLQALVNPIIQNAHVNDFLNEEQATNNQSELTLTISSDPSSVSGSVAGVVNQSVYHQNMHIGMIRI
jgi:hypothetical protein